MLGDGEIQEGQIWEAAMFGAFHKVDNVVAIVDYNKIQLDGFVKDIMELEPLADKWRSFGWHVIELDGHDIPAAAAGLRRSRRHQGQAHRPASPTPSRARASPSWRTIRSSTASRPPPDEVEVALKELA